MDAGFAENSEIWRNKLYQIVTWSKSFEVPWNNVNVPLVVQNKDNIFTSSVIRSQKYWYFTINSLVRFAHSFVYLVKYQYFCSLIPSVVKILSLFFTTRGTLLHCARKFIQEWPLKFLKYGGMTKKRNYFRRYNFLFIHYHPWQDEWTLLELSLANSFIKTSSFSFCCVCSLWKLEMTFQRYFQAEN